MAQTQPTEKLHAACDECRKPKTPAYCAASLLINRRRDSKVEVFRRKASMWKMSRRKDRVYILAAEDDGPP